MAFPASFRPSWKGLPGTNTIAYFSAISDKLITNIYELWRHIFIREEQDVCCPPAAEIGRFYLKKAADGLLFLRHILKYQVWIIIKKQFRIKLIEIFAIKCLFIATFKRCLHCGDNCSELELFKIEKKFFFL
jgi:hypothetical protein